MAEVSLRRAADAERPVIERLLELYLYDMAEVHSFPIGPDGLYHYERLQEFWQHPYLLLSGDDIAGLALVIERCPITGREPCFFMFVRPLCAKSGHAAKQPPREMDSDLAEDLSRQAATRYRSSRRSS